MATNGTELRRSARLANRYSQSTTENNNEDEIHFKLITFFKRYTKSSASTDITKCIRNSLRHFSSQLRNEEFAIMYLEVVIAVFEILRVTDSHLIRNALEELFLQDLRDCFMFRKDLEPPSLLRLSPKGGIHYEVMPGCVKKFSIDSFFYQAINLMSFWSYIATLLRYGLRFGMEEGDVYHCLPSTFFYLESSEVLAAYTVEEEEEMVSLLKDRYKTYGEQRRLYFVHLAIFMVYRKEDVEDEHFERTARNFKLIFKSIRDPLITITEITGFLEVILKSETEKGRIADFCNTFLKEFPRSAEPPQPRSLQHLCRCVVRECLTKSMNLPHGVWSLYLPKRLRNYILMQKTEDEFHNQFVKDLIPEEEAVDHPIPKRQRTF